MKDLRLLQTKKSPRKEMTSLYQRMLTFMVRMFIRDLINTPERTIIFQKAHIF